jgi:UDP-N-acetylglucosamine transferase subunit ALG13
VTALVVALTGTDHHRFERMVHWIDAAALRHQDVRFVVQHGASRPPSVAEGHEFLAHDHLMAMLAEACVVVCHGGPGTIMDAQEAGHVPLCVPRDPRLGEHVDGHQQRFAAAAAGAGVVLAISSLEAFHRALDDALVAPASVAIPAPRRVRDEARARVAAELDDIITVRPRRLGRLHRASR